MLIDLAILSVLVAITLLVFTIGPYWMGVVTAAACVFAYSPIKDQIKS